MRTTLDTPRVHLRPWSADDLDRLVELCSDAAVMRHFPAVLDRAACEALLQRLMAHQAQHGFSYFCAERRGSGAFLGFVGLMHQDHSPVMPPCVDIGWRLVPSAWGQGLAVEGAHAALAFAWDELALSEVHAHAPLVNTPSIGVMERLGMERLADFDHPSLTLHPALQRCAHFVARRPVGRPAPSRAL